jgi:hypothetical protein
MATNSAITPELLDQLLANYEKPEDLTGEDGLFKQLKKALIERALHAANIADLSRDLNSPAASCTISFFLLVLPFRLRAPSGLPLRPGRHGRRLARLCPRFSAPSRLFSCQSCVSRLVGDLSVVINHQTSVSHTKNHC